MSVIIEYPSFNLGPVRDYIQRQELEQPHFLRLSDTMSTDVSPPLTFLLILAAKEGRGRQGAAPLAGLKGMNIPLLSDLSRAAELSCFLPGQASRRKS